MSGLTLTQQSATTQRLDMSPFTPERLAGMTPEQIARLPVHVGNRTVDTGELFRINGRSDGRLVVMPAADNLDNLGAEMQAGEMVVEGNAGFLAGRRQAGGELHVVGSTGDRAGAGMSGGSLVIDGDSGDRLGAPLTGETQGMSGGLIRVGGRVGDRAGERMRRGILVVTGDAGAYLAANMIAGTIAVGGHAGTLCGSGMRRGTLLLARPPASLPATFNYNGIQVLGFLSLLFKRGLVELPPALGAPGGRVRRFLGDLADHGQGEVLIPDPTEV